MSLTILGWLPGELLLPAAIDALRRATLIFAAKSFAEHAATHAPRAAFHPFERILAELPARCAAALAAGETVVVAATGDPLFHGIAAGLVTALGPEQVTIVPERSTVQLACARFALPWHDATLVSAHGRVTEPWSWANAPHHPLRPILAAAAQGRPLIVALTAPQAGGSEIAAALLALGLSDADYRIHVAARLGMADEALFRDLTLSSAAAASFPHPHIALLTRQADAGGKDALPTTDTPQTLEAPQTLESPPLAHPLPLFGLPDDAYLQRQPEKGLITKREVRVVALAELALTPDATVWDIGAGSGSVGLEAGRVAPNGAVWAFEKNEADVAIALKNARRLRAWNWTIRQTKAPEGLEEAPDPDAIFIGGSGGELAELLATCWQRLKPGGRLVANFVTIENLATATATLSALNAPWRATQLWAARSKPILSMHRFAAENPVWLVTATKEGPA
ncbi:bifunctional cobalt-precorrin-7 (C(5))-methyltransferase/cobalt-precorrin-6B (C(15))-methyltransferase [Hydrogenophilus islandicus]